MCVGVLRLFLVFLEISEPESIEIAAYVVENTCSSQFTGV